MNIGNTPWNKGKPWSQEVKTRISLGKRGLINQPRPCACGCGNLTRHGHKWVQGHNLRVKNPMDNSESIKKMRKSRRSQRVSPKTEFKAGNIPWWIERKLPHPTENPEVMNKIRESRLNQVFPSTDTSIEVILQHALEEKELLFKTHFPVIGQPDIAFPDKKVAVFCDGCYWHGCPICGYDTLRPNHDERVTSQLEGKGWTVLRFWEHEIKENERECVRQIEQVLQ